MIDEVPLGEPEPVPISTGTACRHAARFGQFASAAGLVFALALRRPGARHPCAVLLAAHHHGRHAARVGLNDTLEVRLAATDGSPMSVSALFARARRAALALGYRSLVYELAPDSEFRSGLRAAGLTLEGVGEGELERWTAPAMGSPPPPPSGPTAAPMPGAAA
jgi:hypothetical protein